MGLFKSKSENEKNIKTMYDEILRLSEQMNSVKKEMEENFPLLNSLSKMKEEIDELKKKTISLEQYKSNAESLSKLIDELKQNDEKYVQKNWPLIFSIVIGVLFLFFSAVCVWFLLFSTECVPVNDSIPMLISGAIVYLVMAIILVLFAYHSRYIFNLKEKNNTKK